MHKFKMISPVYEQMSRFSALGEENWRGAKRYGKAPHVAPAAFLHTLYPPLTDDQVLLLGETIGKKIPGHLTIFYKECNGFHYFSDTLSIDGLRINGVAQPYGIEIPNVNERLRDANDDMIFIGGYSWDGSLIYTKEKDEKIYFCSPESSKPLKSWESIEDFIADEANRIAALFDARGVQIDEDQSTLPV
ncbi:MAG: SMI1/KNR4 family protein [Betaproteobacteria bacterium]|nr:SMI1/KNR4 family protein [Betaproteobacteria bacterium]